MSDKLAYARELADVMCNRFAERELKVSLPNNYWNLPTWKARYTQQIIAANGLLSVYDIEAIRAALKRKDGSWQWSLRTKALVNIIRDEQTKLDLREKQLKKNTETKTYEYQDPNEVVIKKQKQGHGKQSLRSKLD